MTGSLPDDTELDAIAAQVRAFPPLDDAAVGRLLRETHDQPSGPAGAHLVEHSLGRVLDAVLERRSSGLDLLDLYQEGSVAATVAVAEYAARGGDAAGLTHYVDRVVGTFLDDVVERAATQRKADEEIVRQAEQAETAEMTLRRILEREPTVTEMAAALEWPETQVEAIMEAVHAARAAYDEEIAQFLDDDPGERSGDDE